MVGFAIASGVEALVEGGGHDVLHRGLALGEDGFEFVGLFGREVEVFEERGVAGLDGRFLLHAQEGLHLGLGHQVAQGRELLQRVGGARPAATAAVAPIGGSFTGRGGQQRLGVVARGALGGELVPQLFVEFFQVPRAFLEVGAFVLVHRGGAEFDEFGVLLPREDGAADGGESEQGDEGGLGGVHGGWVTQTWGEVPKTRACRATVRPPPWYRPQEGRRGGGRAGGRLTAVGTRSRPWRRWARGRDRRQRVDRVST